MELIVEKNKKTEVGVIPNDWIVKRLGDLGKFSKGSGVRKDEAMSGERPCIRYGELYTRHNDYIKQFYSFISDDISKTAKKLKKGDILFAGSGETKAEIGKSVAFIDDFEAYAGGDIVILSPVNVDPLYLGYLLNAPLIQKQKASRGQGDAVVHISATQLSNILIPLPPTIIEQSAIATALSETDVLINSLEELIIKKQKIKQGAMKRLMEPKAGWLLKKLEDFLDYEQPTEYLVTDTEYNDNNQTPVLTAGKTFILGYTNEEHGIFKKLPVIIFDDFTTAIKYVDFPFKAKSSAMKMLIPKNDKINLRFVYEIMLQIKYQVADHKRHWIGEYSKLEINVPPTNEEQNAIAKILSDMDNEITVLESKLEKLKKVRLGMMQNLLTGKTRLV